MAANTIIENPFTHVSLQCGLYLSSGFEDTKNEQEKLTHIKCSPKSDPQSLTATEQINEDVERIMNEEKSNKDFQEKFRKHNDSAKLHDY